MFGAPKCQYSKARYFKKVCHRLLEYKITKRTKNKKKTWTFHKKKKVVNC